MPRPEPCGEPNARANCCRRLPVCRGSGSQTTGSGAHSSTAAASPAVRRGGRPRRVASPGASRRARRSSACRRDSDRSGSSGSSSASRASSCRKATARLRVEHARRRGTHRGARARPARGLEQPELRAPRDERDDVEQRRAATPAAALRGKHRVASRLRQGRGAEAREHLGDEERIAGRPARGARPVDALRPGEPRPPRPRAAGTVRRWTPASGGELAEHGPQGMRALELVVAVGGDRRRAGVPSIRRPSRRSDVERRLVGPVEVLEHDDAGRTGAARPGVPRARARRRRRRRAWRRAPRPSRPRGRRTGRAASASRGSRTTPGRRQVVSARTRARGRSCRPPPRRPRTRAALRHLRRSRAPPAARLVRGASSR